VVADVGAGPEALLSVIRSAAPEARVIALDASPGVLHLARTRRGAAAIRADALALPLAAAAVVILACVLFHLTDPPQALAEAARVLRPGGRVAAITWAWERASRRHHMGPDPHRGRAAQLAPAVAIEAITARLDAGQPEPALAAGRVRQAVIGVIGAAAASDVDCSLRRSPAVPALPLR
jgi:SAM-dependent methyltransferase